MITEIENRQGSELKENFYFIRHAQSEANVQMTGGGDPKLTALGEGQATLVGIELKEHFTLSEKKPVALIHTGFERTRQTLEIISRLNKSEITPIEMVDFRERYLGVYEEQPLDKILGAPELAGLYETYGPSCVWFLKSENKGVEPLSLVYERIEKGILVLQQRFGDLPVLLVGHAGTMKIVRKIYESGNSDNLASYLAGFVPKNCEIYKLG